MSYLLAFPKRKWTVKPRRGENFGQPLLWQVYHNRSQRMILTTMTLPSAMQFIERIERGEMVLPRGVR